MEISVVVPILDEKKNIKPLLAQIKKALGKIRHEIVLVDDGSTDGTREYVASLKQSNLVYVQFTRNFGQSAAMRAGIDEARGKFIATMDGELQNDASDIPKMLELLKKKKLDVVSGIRKNRKDGIFLRKIPSAIANWLIRKTTGIVIHDYGCSLKIFKSEVAKNLDLYGELHRFIPLMAIMRGAKIGQMKVKHHARKHGNSHYGLRRIFKVVSDLMLMIFFLKYRSRPMHFFGQLGILSLTIGSLFWVNLLIDKFGYDQDIGTRPMMIIASLLIITGVQLISTGFLAEQNMRTYFESQDKKPYVVRRILKAKTKK